MALLDAYERKARLTPGLLAFAPVAFVVATLGLKRFPAISIVGAVVSAAGGGYVLSVLVGHFGRKAQDKLWASWGGAPTTRVLRTRETSSNPIQRDAWRSAIEVVTGVALLSSRREAANPTAADNAIETAVGQVRYIGQDGRFPLVGAENAQYGLERNLYGFRWCGRLIAAICMLGLVAILVVATSSSVRGLSPSALLAGAIIDGLFLLGWLFIPSAARAQAAGNRYANQLLQAVVNLSRSGGATGTTQGETAKEEPSGSNGKDEGGPAA